MADAARSPHCTFPRHGRYDTIRKVTIAEVEEIVPAGQLDPDLVHTPGGQLGVGAGGRNA